VANKIGLGDWTKLTKLDKIGDSGVKRVILSIVGARPFAAPRIRGRDNEAGKMSI